MLPITAVIQNSSLLTAVPKTSLWKFVTFLVTSFICLLLLSASLTGVHAQSNPIILENQQPGTQSWKITQAANDTGMQIKGYGSATSINKGENITFYVTVTPAQSFSMEIYRMGWYSGNGGRLMSQIGPIAGVQQPEVNIDPNTGLIVAPWASSHTLNVPTTWTSGIYMAKLINSAGYQNYIPFVVRDDARSADFLYQQSITTDQAYNNFPDDDISGKSLYDYNSFGPGTSATGGRPRAAKVSFDRPYSNDGSGLFFKWEYDSVLWLEKSGYDVTYSTNIDTHRNGAALRNYKAFLSVGHDEYWTNDMRNGVEQARDNGVNLFFFGSNVAYWQVRLENGANGQAHRVLVCYKDASLDPEPNAALKTIKFRDMGRSEQSLVGVQYITYNSASLNTDFVVQNSNHWVYANTGFTDGDRVSDIVGYEADHFDPSYPMPVNINHTFLSASPYTGQNGVSAISQAVIYQAPSMAWVFASGTMSWSWALNKSGYIDARIQQTTKNILDQFRDGGGSVGIAVINPGDQTNLVNEAIALQINASNPNNRPLTYSATGLPNGLSLNITTGLISGSANIPSTNTVTITVNDDQGNSDSTAFLWTINEPPTVGCGGPILEAETALLSGSFTTRTHSAASGGQYIEVPDRSERNSSFGTLHTATFCFRVTQPGIYRIVGLIWSPTGGSNSFYVTINGAPDNGYIWGTPTSNSFIPDYIGNRGGPDPLELFFTNGDHTVVIHHREDGTKLDRLQLELVNGNGSNQPPTLTNPGTQTTLLNSSVNLALQATDPDGDPLTFSETGLPAGLGLNANTGQITGIVTASGLFNVNVTVDDGQSNTDSVSFSWLVNEENPGTCGPLVQEGELAQLSGRFTVVSDAAASGGQYIEVPNGNGNGSVGGPDYAEFCFSITQAGTYKLLGSVWAPNNGSNSFYVTIDGLPTEGHKWGTPTGATFIDDYVSHNGVDVSVNLSAGDHTVTVYLREDGTKLDSLTLELVP